MRGLWLFGAFLGLGLSSASCSGNTGTTGSGGSGSGNVSTPSGFCDGTFGAVVDYFESRCSAEDKKADSYLFFWGFLSAAVQECSTALQASIDSGRASLDAGAA